MSALPLLAAAFLSVGAEPSSFAIVVGYNESRNATDATLRYADDDAVQYANLFKDLGAEVRLLVELDAETQRLYPGLRSTRPPSRQSIRDAFDEFARWRQTHANTTLYFVYAGHGDVRRGEGSLALSDGELTRSAFHREILDRATADANHVIIDACKSYFMVFDRSPAAERFTYDEPFGEADPLERWPNTGFLLSTSSAKNSHEWEAFQGGVFSHELRSALRGAADANRDDRVTYDEALSFIRTANQRVKNLKFVPEVKAVPLRSGEPLAELSGVAGVVFDRGLGNRMSVEDSDGVRLADLRTSFEPKLILPPGRRAYVLDADRSVEYRLPKNFAGRLSTVRPRRPRVGSRGAAHEAFELLFEAPFGEGQVRAAELWSLEQVAPPPPPKRSWLWAGLGTSAAVGLGGAGALLYSESQYNEFQSTADANTRARLRRRIEASDNTAWALFGTAALTGLTTLVLYQLDLID